MSWSGNCVIPKGTSAEDARKLIDEIVVAGNDDCPSEREEAAELARDAVKVLLELDSIEDGWQNPYAFNVSIGGHVNPGNMPRSGWSTDYTNINVTQVKE